MDFRGWPRLYDIDNALGPFDAPGGVGGLRILETLTINELYQCHPPSPLIFIESADWDFGTI